MSSSLLRFRRGTPGRLAVSAVTWALASAVAATAWSASAAEPVPAPPQATAAEAADEVVAARAQPPALTGYALESGQRLPIAGYVPYKTARLRWNAGFVTTLSSIALLGTGVGALLLGSQGREALTWQGQNQALATGGVLTGLGAAGVTAGIIVWSLARRDLRRIERELPQDAGQDAGSAGQTAGQAAGHAALQTTGQAAGHAARQTTRPAARQPLAERLIPGASLLPTAAGPVFTLSLSGQLP